MQEAYKIKKEKREHVNGYFTIEASLIIPLVIFLISGIFYLTFFLYDRCIASQDAYLLAFRGSLCCDKNAGEIEQYVHRLAKEQLGERYIASIGLQNSVYADNSAVEVTIEGCVNAVYTKQLLTKSRWDFQEHAKAERICPVKLIRSFRLIKKIGGSILGSS